MTNLASSLVKAQRAFAPALKKSLNPHFKNKYVDLAGCVEAVIDALNSNGIMLMQPTHLCDDGVTVETVFLHESGEKMSAGVLHVPASKQDAQGYGSSLTYARRYSLMAACGIAPEDDDGNAASRRQEPKPVMSEAEYEAFRDEYLPKLRQGAMNGSTGLQEEFRKVPKSEFKTRLWTEQGASLKQAATQFDGAPQ